MPVPPELPTTFRPLWARRVIYPVAVIIVVAMVAGTLQLPPVYRLPDRVGIILVGLAIAYVLHRIGAVRLEADAEGLTVVNVVRRRRLEWPQVVRVALPPGDPWLTLDLSDGDTLAVMGIQGSDGRYAREQASRLAQLVAQRSRTDRDS